MKIQPNLMGCIFAAAGFFAFAFQICVGADAHIGPAECSIFTEICGEFAASKRAGRAHNRNAKRFGEFDGS